uniref:Gnk2-homologous domain-containing protein n=1 Tax=Chenopodium quinoa TaxID=63459 RepID=A0A803NE97_CHEQI
MGSSVDCESSAKSKGIYLVNSSQSCSLQRNRLRRGLTNDPRCTRCDGNLDETLLHTLRDCPAAAAIWRSVGSSANHPSFWAGNLEQWLIRNLDAKELISHNHTGEFILGQVEDVWNAFHDPNRIISLSSGAQQWQLLTIQYEYSKPLYCSAVFVVLNNVNLLLSDFIEHSSANNYYNTSIGDSSDRVYGYYMCRADVDLKTCSSCILNGSDHIDANVSNYQQFNRTLSSTLKNLINETAFGSENNGSRLRFATIEARVTEDETIYSLAQCTPDIAGVNCSRSKSSLSHPPESFFKTNVGEVSERAYGSYLCRGDLSAKTCSNCLEKNKFVKNAFSDVTGFLSRADITNSDCYGTGVYYNDPQCIVHYANRSTFDVYEKGRSLDSDSIGEKVTDYNNYNENYRAQFKDSLEKPSWAIGHNLISRQG